MNDDEQAMNWMREAIKAYDARDEMELCRVPLPVRAETFSRLALAVAMEFEGATVRQDGDVLVVVAPVLEGRTANTPEVMQ